MSKAGLGKVVAYVIFKVTVYWYLDYARSLPFAACVTVMECSPPILSPC